METDGDNITREQVLGICEIWEWFQKQQKIPIGVGSDEAERSLGSRTEGSQSSP